jgi:hypothetical protein
MGSVYDKGPFVERINVTAQVVLDGAAKLRDLAV